MKKIALITVILAILSTLYLSVGCQQSSTSTGTTPWVAYTTNTTNGGLASNNIWVITQDGKGNLWFGTDCGASRYDGKNWRTFTTKDGLSGNRVSAITQDNKGNLWFGTNGGVSRYDGQNWTIFTDKDGLPFHRGSYGSVRAIFLDGKGNLWFAGEDGRVSCYDGTSWQAFTIGTRPPPTHPVMPGPLPVVEAIAEDKQGNLWFGTNGGGVTRYDGTTWRTFTSKDGLAGDSVNAILPDKQGNIWFANADKTPGISSSAVSQYDGTNWTSFNYKNGLLGVYANAVEEDNQGNIWVGTGTTGGVSRYDGADWRTFTTRDGLAGPDVRAIFKDRQGKLWFGTNGGGVSCYDTSLETALPPPVNPETIPDRKISLPSSGPVFPPPGSSIDVFIKKANLPGVGMIREIIGVPEKKVTVFEVSYNYTRVDLGDFQGRWSQLLGMEYGDKIGWIANRTERYDFDASDTYLFTEEFWKLFESKDNWNYRYTFLPFLAADPDVPREVLAR